MIQGAEPRPLAAHVVGRAVRSRSAVIFPKGLSDQDLPAQRLAVSAVDRQRHPLCEYESAICVRCDRRYQLLDRTNELHPSVDGPGWQFRRHGHRRRGRLRHYVGRNPWTVSAWNRGDANIAAEPAARPRFQQLRTPSRLSSAGSTEVGDPKAGARSEPGLPPLAMVGPLGWGRTRRYQSPRTGR